MGIAIHMDYKFELDGKTYQWVGAEWGETEKESDLAELQADVEANKASAICHALDLSIEELTDEVEKAKFDWVEIYA